MSLEEVNSRIPTCRKCKARFHVFVPMDPAARQRLRQAKAESGVVFIRELRELTGASLADAKAVMLHVARENAECHGCGASLEPGMVTDCSRCRSLNISLGDAGA
jgi:hypothetical protein